MNSGADANPDGEMRGLAEMIRDGAPGGGLVSFQEKRRDVLLWCSGWTVIISSEAAFGAKHIPLVDSGPNDRGRMAKGEVCEPEKSPL